MILVTGGTGLVGAHLLWFLTQKEHKVRATYRRQSDFSNTEKVFQHFTPNPEPFLEQIEWVEADITDIPALNKAFEGVHVVYHAAALVSFNPKDFKALQKVNIEGTANIVNLSLSHQVKKLCHFSSIAALGKGNNQTVSEDSFWNPDEENNVYAISKYGAEMEVWRGTQEGLNAVILNPGVILGSGFWHSGTGTFFSKIDNGLSFYTKGKVGLVDVVDAVKIALALTESNTSNERFILVADTVSYQTFFTSAAKALNQDPPKKEAKPWMLYILWQIDRLKRILPFAKRRIFKSMVASAFREVDYDNQKIQNVLGYTFMPVEKTINRVATDYLQETNSK